MFPNVAIHMTSPSALVQFVGTRIKDNSWKRRFRLCASAKKRFCLFGHRPDAPANKVRSPGLCPLDRVDLADIAVSDMIGIAPIFSRAPSGSDRRSSTASSL
jgi:hypothetical protein